jgi:uncharacterized protein (TIGR02001 family)
MFLFCARYAAAQASASLTLESDYRFRGVLLGGDRPSLRASVNYDGPRGWYGGGSISRAEFADGERYAQLVAYAGRVLALSPVLDVDGGISYWRFSGGGYDFAEAYAGLLARRWSIRVNYSPNYFSQNLKTIYIDASTFAQINDDWRVFAHLGELLRLSPARPADTFDYAYGAAAGRNRWDVRTGVGWAARENLDIQFAWSSAGRKGPAPAFRQGRRAGWSAGATWFF